MRKESQEWAITPYRWSEIIRSAVKEKVAKRNWHKSKIGETVLRFFINGEVFCVPAVQSKIDNFSKFLQRQGVSPEYFNDNVFARHDDIQLEDGTPLALNRRCLDLEFQTQNEKRETTVKWLSFKEVKNNPATWLGIGGI